MKKTMSMNHLGLYWMLPLALDTYASDAGHANLAMHNFENRPSEYKTYHLIVSSYSYYAADMDACPNTPEMQSIGMGLCRTGEEEPDAA
jgi:hypothetical protein